MTNQITIEQARNKIERIFNAAHEDGCDFDFISENENHFEHDSTSIDIEIDVNEAASGKIFPAFFRENITIRHIAPTFNEGGSPTVRIGVRVR